MSVCPTVLVGFCAKWVGIGPVIEGRQTGKYSQTAMAVAGGVDRHAENRHSLLPYSQRFQTLSYPGPRESRASREAPMGKKTGKKEAKEKHNSLLHWEERPSFSLDTLHMEEFLGEGILGRRPQRRSEWKIAVKYERRGPE